MQIIIGIFLRPDIKVIKDFVCLRFEPFWNITWQPAREKERRQESAVMTVAYNISNPCWTCAPHKAALGTVKILELQTDSNSKLFLKEIGTEQVLLPGRWLEPSLLRYHSDHNICLLYSICSEWRFPRLYVLLIYYLTNTWRGVMVSGTFWITTLIPPTLLSLHLFPARVLLNTEFDPWYLWNEGKSTKKAYTFFLVYFKLG